MADGASESLSPLEQRIVDLMDSGQTNEQVATALGLDRQEVDDHVCIAYRKLGVRDDIVAGLAAANETGERSSFLI